MTTPQERRDLFLDAAEQTEDHNRAMREEYRDGFVDHHDPRDNHPDAADLALMASWDRQADRERGGR